MAKQRHDIGVQKRLTGMLRRPRLLLAYERAKRGHPGPLPNNWRSFSEWKAAGKPRRGHG